MYSRHLVEVTHARVTTALKNQLVTPGKLRNHGDAEALSQRLWG